MAELIIDADFAETIKTDMEIYAHEVNENRAIPSIYDGLKPVQRRVLYWLSENKGDKGFLGCAQITGGVLGAYHPHGDGSAYEALVRLSQPLIMRYPLIDFDGNNGSLTDPPGAFRYTKAKLSKYGLALLQDIEYEGAVRWKKNYDESKDEPCYLMGTLGSLNLLMNPQIGIGVGMASNFSCHHLTDIIAAMQYRIDNPSCSLDELLENVNFYPSFYNSGVLINKSDIPNIYKTGRGSIVLQSKYEWTKDYLLITELPYRIDASKVRQKIVDKKKEDGSFEYIHEIYEDAGTLKIYPARRGIDQEAFVKRLFKATPLQNSYSINMQATDERGEPRLWPLLDILDFHIKQQHHRLIRKAEHFVKLHSHKKHIAEGIRKALLDIDNVISIIRESDNDSQAKTALQKALEIDLEQATAICNIRLGRLSRMEKKRLDDEILALQILIDEQLEIQSNPSKRIEVYLDEISVFKDNSPKTECLSLMTKGIEGDRAQHPFVLTISDKGFSVSYDSDAPTAKPDDTMIMITNHMRGFIRQGSDFLVGESAFSDLVKLNPDEKIIFVMEKSKCESFTFFEIETSDGAMHSLHKTFILLGASARGKKLVNGKHEVVRIIPKKKTSIYPKLK